MRATEAPSDRTRVRRLHDRAAYDAETIHAILDAAAVCHVAIVEGDFPAVIPMAFARVDDAIVLHGSSKSRLMVRLGSGAPACVTVTHLDGLVLARSAFHHSANYRSVVLFGKPKEVTDPGEREARMRVFMEQLIPGRWDTLRPVKPKELKATRLIGLRIDEASAKIRSGPPADDAADVTWPTWGGVLPLSIDAGEPQPDEHERGKGRRAPLARQFRR